jgi:nucleoside-diphosphate-sugar epimerase
VVAGPFIHPVATPDQLNDTVKVIWDIFSGATKTVPSPIAAGAYVDVRDVAAVSLFAVEHPELVAEKRIPVVAGQGPPQAVADILREHYPERRDVVPEGTVGAGYRRGDWKWAANTFSFSSTLIEDMMHIEWIPFDNCVLDTVKGFHLFFASSP